MLGKEGQSTWLTSQKPGQKGPEMPTVESPSTCDYHKKFMVLTGDPRSDILVYSLRWFTVMVHTALGL